MCCVFFGGVGLVLVLFFGVGGWGGVLVGCRCISRKMHTYGHPHITHPHMESIGTDVDTAVRSTAGRPRTTIPIPIPIPTQEKKHTHTECNTDRCAIPSNPSRHAHNNTHKHTNIDITKNTRKPTLTAVRSSARRPPAAARRHPALGRCVARPTPRGRRRGNRCWCGRLRRGWVGLGLGGMVVVGGGGGGGRRRRR